MNVYLKQLRYDTDTEGNEKLRKKEEEVVGDI